MKSKHLLLQIVLICSVLLFYPGCAEKNYLVLNFVPDQPVTYKAVRESRKDYLWLQPSAGKTTEKTTHALVEMTYRQTTSGLDEQGNALADIEIQDLKYVSEDSGGVPVDFDSTRQADAKKPLARLIGQSYTIKLSPIGEVLEVLNISQARKAVTAGSDASIAAALLSDAAITDRHGILALPDRDTVQLAAGDTWTRIKASPKGALVPKSYEKIYTVKAITGPPGDELATIEMTSIPSSVQAKDLPEGAAVALGAFSEIFDSNEFYTGRLVLHVQSGKVQQYYEKYQAQYNAAEYPKGRPRDKGPDVLQLGFFNSNSIEAVD